MCISAPVPWLLQHLSDDQGSSGSSWTATPPLYWSIVKGVFCLFKWSWYIYEGCHFLLLLPTLKWKNTFHPFSTFSIPLPACHQSHWSRVRGFSSLLYKLLKGLRFEKTFRRKKTLCQKVHRETLLLSYFESYYCNKFLLSFPSECFIPEYSSQFSFIQRTAEVNE